MATAAQLYRARNAGLKLAHVTQPYAQADIPLANEAAAAARAVVQAAADEAVTAATAIGGSLVATEAVVANGDTLTVVNFGNGQVTTAATFTVAANAVTNVKLPGTIASVGTGSSQTGVTVTGTGTTATFTVSGGVITAIALA